MWEFLSNDWSKFLGTTTLSAMAAGAIAFLMKRRIDSTFNKTLEDHKSELAKENERYKKDMEMNIEKLRGQIQRSNKDYELYITKRHERYPELYKSIETAAGHILALHREGMYLTFENCNREDIENYMSMQKFTIKDTSNILALWNDNGDNTGALKKLAIYQKRVLINIAYQKWDEANDTLLFNELYISDSVSSQARSILDSLYAFLKDVRIGLVDYNTPPVTEEHPINKGRKQLKEAMKLELSRN